MGFMERIGLYSKFTTGTSPELPEIFPVPVAQSDFVRIDVVTIYRKILTDVAERTHGLSDDEASLLWDNCVMDSSSDGLITMLAKAMASKGELFLVYESAVYVIRKATSQETQQIRADYEAQGESPVGVYVSFKGFDAADMVRFYVALEYCAVAGMYKSSNMAKAIQLKIAKLREGVGLADAQAAADQAVAMAKALAAGRDVLLDSEDEITTLVPDMSPVKESVAFLSQKLSFYLGLPASYLTGEQTGGIGSTGENDTRAVERGLKAYYFSVMKPVLEALFESTLSYKSQDFRMAATATELLKTFALIDDTLVSADNKRRIINQLLDLPEDAQGDAAPAPAPLAPPAPRAAIPGPRE